MGSSRVRTLQTEQIQRPWGRKEFDVFEVEREGANTAERQEEEKVGDEGGGVTEVRSWGL